METYVFNLVGINGARVPLIAPTDITLPGSFVKLFPACCGAGDGIGNLIVPETIWGVPISPACFVHDKMWGKAAPTWEAFHHSNSVFLTNIIAHIQKQSSSKFLEHIRMYRAVTYYNAVNTLGASVFWGLKLKQGLIDSIPEGF